MHYTSCLSDEGRHEVSPHMKRDLRDVTFLLMSLFKGSVSLGDVGMFLAQLEVAPVSFFHFAATIYSKTGTELSPLRQAWNVQLQNVSIQAALTSALFITCQISQGVLEIFNVSLIHFTNKPNKKQTVAEQAGKSTKVFSIYIVQPRNCIGFV